MPITYTAPAATCDCCGATIDLGAFPAQFLQDQILNVVLCTATVHNCAARFTAQLNTLSYNTIKAAHTAIIIGGIIPAHP